MNSLRTIGRMLDAVLDSIRRVCVVVTGVAMVVLVTIFAWLVFGRYVLNETPTWVEQLSLVLVCYIAFIGAAVGVRDDTHLGVTFFRDGLPLRLRQAVHIVAEAMLTAFGLVMVLACTKLVAFGWDTMLPMLNVPEGVRTLPAALCGGLIFLFSGARVIRMTHQFLTGDGSYKTPEA